MEDSTGEAKMADDPRDPRVALFERLLHHSQTVMISSDGDHEYVGVAVGHEGQIAVDQSYFAMDLIERLANSLGVTS